MEPIAVFSSWTASAIPFRQVLGSTNMHPRGLGVQGNNNVLNKLPSNPGEGVYERLIICFPMELLRQEPLTGRRHIRKKMTVKPYYQKMTQDTGFVLDIEEGQGIRFPSCISIQVVGCSCLSTRPCVLEMLSCGFRLEICPVALRRTGSNTWEVNAGSFFTCHSGTSLCWKINWLAITLSTSVKHGCWGSIHLPTDLYPGRNPFFTSKSPTYSHTLLWKAVPSA